MRKSLIILLALVVSFSFIAPSLAVNFPATEEVSIFGKGRAPDGTTSPVEIVKVRYANREAGGTQLNSGDVVVWDTTSADGYTISALTNTSGDDPSYAGVLVTDIESAETNIVRGFGRNIGYMAIKGYCLARTDSGATAGQGLITAGAGTVTKGFASQASGTLSKDIGVLLESPSSDGLAPVWLR